MTSRAKALIIGIAMIAWACGAPAQAQLTEFVWDTTKTGSQQWQNAANWSPAGFPNGPLQVGNLSRPLGANLDVSLGATGVTTAGVVMGATAAPRTTIISSTGGLLTFRNEEMAPTADFNGNTVVDGLDFLIWQQNYNRPGLDPATSQTFGDANDPTDGQVNDADHVIWRSQFGLGVPTPRTSAFINSIGAPGSVNTITAPIHLNNEQLDIVGTNNLRIDGNLTYNGDTTTAFGASASALRVLNAGLTVTMNGDITMVNVDDDPNLEGDGGEVDLGLNTSVRARGKLVINGAINGAGHLRIGTADGNVLPTLGTVELNGNNGFTGNVILERGNIYLGSDTAFGVGSGHFRPNIGNNLFGTNLFSTSDTRNISKNMVLAGTVTIKGEHSLTLSGTLTQTNNRQIVNLLPAGKELTLSGRIDVWEDDEPDTERRFEIDGTGVTRITGSIHSNPQETADGIRHLVKRGSGVLIMDMAAGANVHSGNEYIYMGHMHYTTEDSLPAGGSIVSYGGAVGIDTGVANNSTFAGKIDPTSVGGLMLAPSDAGATLDFTSTLANAANMTVAAPEGTTPQSPYNFTGTIVPAGNRYQLGGGTGTIRLGGAQLTGASNRLEVRNGGTVQLFGLNAYGGSTTLLTKYVSTKQDQAAGNNANAANPLNYYQVAPTLEVNKLANGGQPSSIGNSSSAAANLFIQGGTLRYVGAGDTTDRLFTIGTGGATLESSGTGPVVFSNPGALARDDAEDRIGALDEFNRNPNVLYDFTDTSDIIVGMTVDDPDPVPAGGGQPPIPLPAHLIPGPLSAPPAPATRVTGINDTGTELGISAEVPNVYKPTRIVFGAVPRTFNLGGSNTGANILTPTISNSAAGSVVSLVKQGTGTWYLEGMNTMTGTTTVEAGTLGGNGGVGGNLVVNSGATFTPGAVGASAIGDFNVGGSFTLSSGATLGIQLGGTSPGSFDILNVAGSATLSGAINLATVSFAPAIGNQFTVLTAAGGITDAGLTITGLTGFTKSIVGNSLVLTKSAAGVPAGGVVPEPSAVILALGAAAVLVRRRQAATPRG